MKKYKWNKKKCFKNMLYAIGIIIEILMFTIIILGILGVDIVF